MSEQRDLQGLTALVTGATSGIGQAAAVQLGRHGADVIVHGRDAARGAAVAGAITAAGGTARFAAADVGDPAQLNDLAGQAGSADVLVNNAGFSWIGLAGSVPHQRARTRAGRGGSGSRDPRGSPKQDSLSRPNSRPVSSRRPQAAFRRSRSCA